MAREWKIGAAAAGLLCLLTILVALGSPLLGLDQWAAQWRPAVATGEARDVWLWITSLAGGSAVAAVLVAVSVMLMRVGQVRTMLALLLGYLLARIITDGLKAMLSRARPEMTELQQLLAGAGNHAFPSGHATSAIYIYGFLALLAWRADMPRRMAGSLTVCLVVVVAAIGASRLALGVHFASDVLGGFLSGATALALASTAVRYR